MKPRNLVVLSALATALTVPGALSASYAESSAAAPPLASAGQRGVERGVKDVPVPKAARAADVSHPDHEIGDGTPASCTSRKVVRAVAKGGVITFDCGPDPIVIQMLRTAKVFNKRGDRITHRVVIDGGGLVTLSGMGRRRILYQNTCHPPSQWTTSHCDDQAFPGSSSNTSPWSGATPPGSISTAVGAARSSRVVVS